MGKRRSDADSRRFFDEFEKVRISRFRAMGVVDPAKDHALIPFPNGKIKLIGTQHITIRNGGGWSRFLCPKCGRRALVLYLIEDAPLCVKCCDLLNIKDRAHWGFGREARRQACDRGLSELIARLETKVPLRFNGAPASWYGKAKLVYRSKRMKQRMQRAMVVLRLNQLATQQAKAYDKGVLSITRAFTPRKDALSAIPELAQVWRAPTHERLQQALDVAQAAIIKALEDDNPRKRTIAARIMLKTKQGRERGFTSASI